MAAAADGVRIVLESGFVVGAILREKLGVLYLDVNVERGLFL